jgi:hypothetical protein
MTDVFTALVEVRLLPVVRAASDAEAAEFVGRLVHASPAAASRSLAVAGGTAWSGRA